MKRIIMLLVMLTMLLAPGLAAVAIGATVSVAFAESRRPMFVRKSVSGIDSSLLDAYVTAFAVPSTCIPAAVIAGMPASLLAATFGICVLLSGIAFLES